MTQRDDMGRVVGGEFRIGNSCTPMADSCQCMAKPIQYCKVTTTTTTTTTKQPVGFSPPISTSSSGEYRVLELMSLWNVASFHYT